VLAWVRIVDGVVAVHDVLLGSAGNRTWGTNPQGLVPFANVDR
jgi:hypothetical protein